MNTLDNASLVRSGSCAFVAAAPAAASATALLSQTLKSSSSVTSWRDLWAVTLQAVTLEHAKLAVVLHRSAFMPSSGPETV